MISDEEQAQRRWNVDQAFHNAYLSGQTPTPFSYQLAEQWIRGDITLDEWLAETKRKYEIENEKSHD